MSEAKGNYCSAKFALEGLTEALWQEIEMTSHRVVGFEV